MPFNADLHQDIQNACNQIEKNELKSYIPEYPEHEAFHLLKQQLVNAEKKVQYPYLDIVGNITYGYGHMDNSFNGFVSHPWINKNTHLPATKGELVSSFDSIRAAKFGKNIKATDFSNVTNIILEDNYIDNLLDKDIALRHQDLLKNMKNYSQMDPYLQVSILEPHFTSNVLTWPKLRQATILKDKDMICKEIHRNETNRADIKKRNEWAIKQCEKGNFK